MFFTSPLTRSALINSIERGRRNFSGEDLSGLDLSNITALYVLNFNNAKLVKTNFSGSTLYESTFHGADLTDADFTGANLRCTEFNKDQKTGKVAILKGAKFNYSKQLHGAEFLEADLENANFTGTELVQAKFNGANLTGAKFDNADLSGVQFNGAKIQGSNITAADLITASDLSEATFYNSNTINYK